MKLYFSNNFINTNKNFWNNRMAESVFLLLYIDKLALFFLSVLLNLVIVKGILLQAVGRKLDLLKFYAYFIVKIEFFVFYGENLQMNTLLCLHYLFGLVSHHLSSQISIHVYIIIKCGQENIFNIHFPHGIYTNISIILLILPR